jgi:branched-chain amino acid transport system substrate-binding protein
VKKWAFVIGLATGMGAATLADHACAKDMTIAVIAPKSGLFANLGTQIRMGATAAASLSQDTTVEIDESCEAGSGAAIADAIIAAKADAAIGFLCTESLETGLVALQKSDIPAITLSVRADTLMQKAQKKGWPLFSLAPTAAAEDEKAIEMIAKTWADAPFAMIDDGTIHGRELSEAVRLGLEQKGIKPVFADTFRPGQEQQVALVRRLAKSGATHIFIGGDRADIAIIARDARQEELPLVLMGGDTLLASDNPVPLENGVQAVLVPPSPDFPQSREAEKQIVDLVKTAPDGLPVTVEGYMLPAYAATQIASNAITAVKTTATARSAAIAASKTDTAIGPIAFGPGHIRTENPYRLMQWQNGRFIRVDTGTN